MSTEKEESTRENTTTVVPSTNDDNQKKNITSSSGSSSTNASTSLPEESDFISKALSLLIMLGVVGVALYLRSVNQSEKVSRLDTFQKVEIIPELFITSEDGSRRKDNIDSLVVYKHEWLITTAKASNALFIFEAKTGKYLFTKSLKTGDYEANRPNGITLFTILDKEYLFVTERDGRRVCIVDIGDDFKIVYSFGEEVLKRPYALDLMKTNSNQDEETYHVFVTDNYMLKDSKGKLKVVPPSDKLDKRIQLFEIIANKKDYTFQSKYVKKIGSILEEATSGVLNIVETVVIDEAYDRLLIADEHILNIKIYNFSSHEFSGNTIGLAAGQTTSTNNVKCPKDFSFAGEPEGFVIYSCQTTNKARSVETGFYIFTDQLDDRTKFHIVRRDNLCYVGSFMGNVVSKTDGVTIDETLGIFYAVHNDSVIGTFKIKDILNRVVKKNLSASELAQICPPL
ncbi:hypothetical protein NAEGRDRAFT_77971 [Naegleria gruberi]|uniref:BPP domain-containing protein n=1 Tax=Naegleria gruberi TaxID=5762 RepID=D2UZU3_NAEGR|nr:uncharacterized protein NAEGRDRAFT_77971 [Naegleria gruberi]EFC49994.1 hypothetical protein NAEGRDRAFT_77971 [Naegleria gruberi]|eukprot:XP_002682738.1 hypothetical protein NAEGRDRAFT_77971 [Naegleria gruberi strain NEG-M]